MLPRASALHTAFSFAVVLSLASLAVSCTRSALSRTLQPLNFAGPAGREAVVYKVTPPKGKETQPHFAPVVRIAAGSQVLLEQGSYVIANSCSSYSFEHSSAAPSQVTLGKLILVLHGEAANTAASAAQKAAEDALAAASLPPQSAPAAPTPEPVDRNFIHTQCTDPIDGQKSEWRDKIDFDLFPGQSQLLVGGRTTTVSVGAEGNTTALDLYPVTVITPERGFEARFFTSPDEVPPRPEVPVISALAGSTLWLIPGGYNLEVNGTRRKVEVEKGSKSEILMGILRIDMAPDFPVEERMKAGGQPIFAYVNGGVLFNLNTDYLVFPGNYTVSLEGSEVKENYVVEANTRTVVKTFGAQIDVPACPEKFKGCKAPPHVTIHKEQKPYPLLVEETSLPFLVLDGTYEYGVEGLRGILRSLPASRKGAEREKLARIKFNWEVRQASSRTRTDLVRLEGKGTNVFGRSLDLLFHKPDEVYLPAGTYQLTYFVGDPSQERTKTRVDFRLNEGETREVVVPLYTDKVAHKSEQASQNGTGGQPLDANEKLAKEPDTAPQKLPSALVPIRK